MAEEQERRQAAAAAAENQRFLGELANYRAGGSPAAAGGETATDQGHGLQPVTPESRADAQAENVDFQQHVANYDPHLFRRGRRRKVEYDKPTGPKPATVQDAAAADAAFLRSLRNWTPG